MKSVSAIAAEGAGMVCPKCKAPMEVVTFEGISIDRCTRCRGMWFDANEQKLLHEKNGTDAIDIGDPLVGKRMDKITDIDCPRCGVRMIRMVHVDQQTTDYEACTNCYGIFLDAGELRALKDLTMSDYLAGLFEPHKKKATVPSES